MGVGSQVLFLACTAIAACSAPQPTAPADLSTPLPAPTATSQPDVVATAASVPEPETPRRDLALPRAWAALPTAEFEAALARWNPAGDPGRLDPESLDELRVALESTSPTALRAVLLLAASADPEAARVLRARLERRIRTGVPGLPATDIAAAAGLARARDPERAHANVLAELATGRRPHPVLSVRVECAAAALALGRDDLTAFLAAVLLDGTPQASELPATARGATSIEEMAFAQWRAATTLARHAHIDNPYRPEASAVERQAAAAELVRAVAAHTTGGSRP